MKLIINNSSMIPIYEQISDQIKNMIIHEELKNDDILPSVRSLANDLKISALTVKKAYDYLENLGYTKTVHGKGTYVCCNNKDILLEECKKELENDLLALISKARRMNISNNDIKDMLDILLGED